MAQTQTDEQVIFENARKMASWESREAYLQEACGDDHHLREQVVALIRAFERNESFLEHPPLELGFDPQRTSDYPISQDLISETPGAVIGSYKLIQQIGEGGFGVVFLAEQERPVKRRVALKVIKPGMDSREVIARFEAERQTLAMMNHPNIAKVFDAGTTGTGRPYFVMELVQGVPITEYCDQCNLTTRERLELFIDVCHAVQHAHQKGVIHRDIKPTNVLVAIQDGKPAPKIIDFGVAKAIGQQLTEHTFATRFAQMVGTPLYMSPEQAELSPLGVDTRSDIYSLGVLLYELLTGTTPFDQDRLRQAGYDEMRRIIREEEPIRPSVRISTLQMDAASTITEHHRTDVRRLKQAVRGDLDWIVMKCLEKDRGRRYASANAVAQDIENYLANQPVVACPPSTGYLLRKFAIRKSALLATATTIVLSLLIGSTVSVWQAIRATNAETLSRERLESESLALERAKNAQQAEATARRAAESALAREAKLREEAEIRVKVATALNLGNSLQPSNAELLIQEIPDDFVRKEPALLAPIYHDLARWHGGRKRWEESAAYYHKILFGNAKSAWPHRTPSMVYLEYCPLLIELGDIITYNTVRAIAIDEYADSKHAQACEQLLFACLLLPADEKQMHTYNKWVDLVTDYTTVHPIEFKYAAQALFDCRRGDYENALDWGHKCLESDPGPACAARARVILVISHFYLNDREQALAELTECRDIIDAKFEGELGVGRVGYDWWADWLIDRVLLSEAVELLDGEHAVEKTR